MSFLKKKKPLFNLNSATRLIEGVPYSTNGQLSISHVYDNDDTELFDIGYWDKGIPTNPNLKNYTTDRVGIIVNKADLIALRNAIDHIINND